MKKPPSVVITPLRGSGMPASKPTPAALSRRRFPVLRPLEIAPDPGNKESSTCYYTDDHVRALVSELGQASTSPCTRRRAARKIRLLAKHSPENRLRIAAAGAVQALVSTLVRLQDESHDGGDGGRAAAACSSAELQEHAVTALYNLSLHDSNLPLVAASGALSPAVRTLGSAGATPGARSGAACLILRLAQHVDVDGGRMVEDIGSSGAIPLLVDLLHTGDLRGQKDAATALYALTSRCAPNRTRAVDAGMVPVLLELMEDPGSGMVEKAAFVLSAIAEADEVRTEVVDCGGAAVLVDMLEFGTTMQREIAVKVLGRMCSAGKEEEYYRSVVASEGAVAALLAVAHPDSGCSESSRLKAKALLETLRQTPSASAGATATGEDE